MQQPVPSGDMFEPSASVVVDGVPVDVSSVQVDREIRDAFTGGGFAAASSTFVGTASDDVSQTVSTPWGVGSWPPVPEAAATVALNVGPGDVQSLTGRVQEVSGDTSGRAVTVDVADLYQTLDRTISWDELADAMPSESEAVGHRYVGLYSQSVTDLILRHCGWYCTPPRLPYSTLSVPAMGTMWPEVGTVETSVSVDRPDGGLYPSFFANDYGFDVRYVKAEYSTLGPYTLQGRGRMEMTALNRTTGNLDGTMHFTVDTGSGGVRLSWSQTTAYVWVTDPAGQWAVAVSTPRVDGLLYARLDYVSEASVRVRLRTDDGVEVDETVPCHTSVTTGGYVNGTIAGDLPGGGFQLAFPNTGGTLVGWKRNATIHAVRDGVYQTLKVRPPIAGVNCTDLLADQCKAEAATYWIDETGMLQWWHLLELDQQPNRATLTADENIAAGGFSWSHAMSSVKSRVVVKWKDYTLSSSWRSVIDLWQGPGASVEPDQRIEEFINVPDDEVWILPYLDFEMVGSNAGSMYDFNTGRRSWWGGVIGDGDEWVQSTGDSLAFLMERINGSTFKYVVHWTGSINADMKTPNAAASTAVSRNKRSMDLPIMRGKAKFTLTDREYTSAQEGPSTAPEHLIDTGWWIQSEAQAQRLADYAAARMCVPHPELSAVSLVMVPGIQLGDTVTIVDDAVSRLTIRGLVVGDSRAMDADMGVTHAIQVRPLQVSMNSVTWAEWGDFMNNAQYQTWGSSQSGKTWSQWGAAPLSS